MESALFEPDADEGVYVPSVYTRGPWDPTLLHGGPVGALFAETMQDHTADEFQPARLTVELMRPVPLEPLTLRTATLRLGRRLQVLEGGISARGKDVARATLVAVRTAPIDATGLNPPLEPPDDTPADVDPSWYVPESRESFVGGGMDFRFTGLRSLGHGVAWLRLRKPVLPGREPSPLARAAAAADVGNAVSSRRDPSLPRISFVNADLSLSLSRLPQGQWIRLESRGRWEPSGVGSVMSIMSDEAGEVGVVTNALVLASGGGPLPWEAG